MTTKQDKQFNKFLNIQIMSALSNSWGLQDSLKTAVEKDDKVLLKDCIQMISQRACINPKYVENNVQQIIQW